VASWLMVTFLESEDHLCNSVFSPTNGPRSLDEGGGGAHRLLLSPHVFALTAEAKAAEAAASAYYNPGNPHNVYMPTVSWQGTAFLVTQPGSWRWKPAQLVL
jgi:hypothetical protein